MGYLFSEPLGNARVAAPCLRRPASATSSPSRLTPLEWSVVALARNDRLASLRPPGRISIAMGNLFGSSPNPRLADPRLEALRRIAVLSWHYGFAVHGSEVDAFVTAGFTIDQYELLVASMSPARRGLKVGRP